MNLKVINLNGIEIKGQGANFEEMDNDVFVLTILGVPYPFFEGEFPHHVKGGLGYFSFKLLLKYFI